MTRSFLAAVLCSIFAGAPIALGATFTVTTTADSVPGSLRQAILDANALAGLDDIHFNIGSGPQIIALASPLPNITDAVSIDGTTQPGFAGTPIVTLDGGGTAPGNGLTIITSARSTIRGLVIVGFGSYGIWVFEAGATIAGNYIGVDASGLVAGGNAAGGIHVDVDSDGNIIGGPAPADRNVISANGGNAIVFRGTIGAGASDDNVVQNNILGLDATASNALGNFFNGVAIDGGDNNLIGGTAPGTGNVISGNAAFGIRISSLEDLEIATGNVIQGNLIGTNGTGSVARPNAFNGIALFGAQATTVGGTTASARNVISANGWSGINVAATDHSTGFLGSNDTVILGNFIGTDSSGTVDLGNGLDGISVAGSDDNTIGGAAAGEGNLISGNGRDGIGFFQWSVTVPVSNNTVRGNRIGTDASGTTPLPNAGAGVDFTMTTVPDTPGNLIGGTAPGEGNVIHFNGSGGIVAGGGVGNRFLGNSIDLNTGLGIDLSPAANNFQPHPELTSATVVVTTNVTGVLFSTPGRTFRIEFFNSPAADPSGFGEGATFLGFTNVTTNGGGQAAIAASLPAVPAGSVVTATATDLTTLDTSEFSNAIAPVVVPLPTLNVGDVTVVEPDAGTAAAVFTVMLTAPAPVDVTFDYATGDGTATAPGDYTPTSGTGFIPAGSLSTTIAVPVLGDVLTEGDETFVLDVSNVAGAVPADAQGQATIDDDDAVAVPALSSGALLLMALVLGIGGVMAMRR